MDVTLPTDCGNAPRIGVVGDFVTAWAAGDEEKQKEWLRDDTEWHVLGAESPSGPTALRVSTIITHGRLASCDGVLEYGDDKQPFSHVFRFASTSKTAKIAEIRTYRP